MRWLEAHDPDYSALRRATRAAIFLPLLFAFCVKILHNPTVALFAAFGSFSMLLLFAFGGTIGDRVRSQIVLAVVCLVLISVGTLASFNTWVAAASTVIVAFGIVFSGVISSEIATATPTMLFAFVLPVTIHASPSTIPDRLFGWSLASAASVFAISFLWPAPMRNPLRAKGVAACSALAARLRADVAYRQDSTSEDRRAAREEATLSAANAIAALNKAFLRTPYRPAGLTAGARSLLRLVDELNWLNAMGSASTPQGVLPFDEYSCAVKTQCANGLDAAAGLLEHDGSPDQLRASMTELHERVMTLKRHATEQLPVQRARFGDDEELTEFVTSLDPGFRAHELAYAVMRVADNIDLGVCEEKRSWLERLLGKQSQELSSRFATAQIRATSHFERHSVWLHNSLRSAIGLGIAVLIATLTGVQHSFWVVLGALAVLRSNALSTGQNAVRALLGTAAGFIIGSLLLAPLGTHAAILWTLLPIAVVIAGVVPSAVSFAAGQAAFTVTLLILFNILAPAGWRIGLIRVEDVGIGCAVSIVVGLLFWPRGAAAALGQALAEAYSETVGYLDAAVSYASSCCQPGERLTTPTAEERSTAAASRRLDDTFRTYLAERGAKPVPLAELTTLITGTTGLRTAADAVVNLWDRDNKASDGDRSAARDELLNIKNQVLRWYDEFAEHLLEAKMPQPAMRHDKQADNRLIAAVRHDLTSDDGHATATAIRLIWTADHLDAVRRLQSTLVEPARATVGARVFGVKHKPLAHQANAVHTVRGSQLSNA